jgi:hypothetical protein
VVAFSLVLACALLGCDRGTPPPPPPASAATPTVDVRAITPLLPRLQTHLAIDSRGNLYWTQESDPPIAGGDLVFVMGDGGVPQTVAALGVDNILTTLGMTGGQGAVRSLAVGPGDQLYALFTGSRGPAAICAVLQYSPGTHKVTVSANTAKVMDASGLGLSIGLARGTLLGSRDALWLWLRHSDGAALLALTAQPGGKLDASKVDVRTDESSAAPNFRTQTEDLSLSADGSLYYVERGRSALWRIDADGRASRVISLVGLSRTLPPPAGQGGHLYFLADAGPKFGGPDAALVDAGSPLVRPNLAEPVLFDYTPADRQVRAFDRTRMDAPTNLPLQSLQPRQLRWDAATGTLVAFDASSGEILRLKIPPPPSPPPSVRAP